MSRDDAVKKLADVLKGHRPDKTFGCQCMAAQYGGRSSKHARAFAALDLEELWAEHVAEIAFEHAKGF